MTPSDAHDSAWQRDAGHDEMQLEVMRAAQSHFDPLNWRGRYGGEKHKYDLFSTEAEKIFVCKSGRRFFADIALEFSRDGKNAYGVAAQHYFTMLFEIKPVIHSAGAVLRQLGALKQSMSEFISGHRQPLNEYEVFAVVRADDPKVQILADLGQKPVWTWDGAGLNLVTPTRMGDAQ